MCAAAVSLAAWCIAVSASATVMVELSLEELIAGADVVVHATVERAGVRRAVRDGRLEPETVVTLRVHEWIVGAGGETVSLRELGGVTADGSGVLYDGTPTYTAGEEVIVFLARRPEAPHDLRTLGMVQGKMRIDRGAAPPRVRRDLSSIAIYDPHGLEAVREPAVREMELAPLLSYLRRLATLRSGQ